MKFNHKKTIPEDMDGEDFLVNLPRNWPSYKSGNGEGVWAVALKEEDYAQYTSISDNGTMEVMLLNDSIHYSKLKWGTIVEAEHRGDKRPVLDKKTLTYLFEKYGEYK